MTNDTPATDNPKKNRSGSNKRQRNWQYVVRCDRGEFNEVAARARESGLKGAAYLRASALGDAGARSQRIPPVEKELLVRVLGQFGRLNSNVNQIAHNGNAGYPVDLPDLRLVMKDYPSIRDAIFQALGKEPSPAIQDWDEFAAVGRKALEASPAAETVTIPAALLRRMVGDTAAPRTPAE